MLWVVAGNHDSPSFLNAPKELLHVLNVYVVGSITDDPADEVFVLQSGGKPEAVVCAVPYLSSMLLQRSLQEFQTSLQYLRTCPISGMPEGYDIGHLEKDRDRLKAMFPAMNTE